MFPTRKKKASIHERNARNLTVLPIHNAEEADCQDLPVAEKYFWTDYLPGFKFSRFTSRAATLPQAEGAEKSLPLWPPLPAWLLPWCLPLLLPPLPLLHCLVSPPVLLQSKGAGRPGRRPGSRILQSLLLLFLLLATWEKGARQQAEARTKAEKTARALAEGRTEIEMKARQEAEARIEAEKMARIQAEARGDIEMRARQEAETRIEAEKIARIQAEARAEVEMKARQEAEARIEAEKMDRIQVEARAEVEKKARWELEARMEGEKAARIQAEARAEIEMKARQEAEVRIEAGKIFLQIRAQRKTKVRAQEKKKVRAQGKMKVRAQGKTKATQEAEVAVGREAGMRRADSKTTSDVQGTPQVWKTTAHASVAERVESFLLDTSNISVSGGSRASHQSAFTKDSGYQLSFAETLGSGEFSLQSTTGAKSHHAVVPSHTRYGVAGTFFQLPRPPSQSRRKGPPPPIVSDYPHSYEGGRSLYHQYSEVKPGG